MRSTTCVETKRFFSIKLFGLLLRVWNVGIWMRKDWPDVDCLRPYMSRSLQSLEFEATRRLRKIFLQKRWSLQESLISRSRKCLRGEDVVRKNQKINTPIIHTHACLCLVRVVGYFIRKLDQRIFPTPMFGISSSQTSFIFIIFDMALCY